MRRRTQEKPRSQRNGAPRATGVGESAVDPARGQAIRRRLRAWYARARRDLPWRRSADPWAILVAEVMLQQTGVDVVVPYFLRFMRRFPTPAALAAAAEPELLSHWSGLGYYRRARNLKAAAHAIVERHGGRLPESHAALRALDGVGDYTAGAVASIAFSLPHPVVDGNVARVLSRLLLLEADPTSAAGRARCWRAAADLLDHARPGDHNQALMELGALVCRPRQPLCGGCPLGQDCAARHHGRVAELPVKRARAAPRQVELAALVLRRRRGDDILLVQRARAGLLGGLLDLPAVELEPGQDPARALRRLAAAELGFALRGIAPAGAVRHTITHRRIRARAFVATGAQRARRAVAETVRERPPAAGIAPAAEPCRIEFLASRALAAAPLTALARKLLAAAGVLPPAATAGRRR